MSILVHHLRVGRSVFTVWLLEELGLDYELKFYDRNEMGRAPPELKEAHPLGKSPVIEIDGFTLSESGAIAAYLVETRESGKALGPLSDDPKAKAEWLQWLHYTEASAFAPLLLKLLLTREQEPKPMLISMFSTGEVALQLGYMQDFLADKEFVLGDTFTAPDIGFAYVCSMAERLGELDPYPKLKAYVDRMTSRPAFVTAMEKTGG
ncbi:MAG: glutathione S-transferase family protein [Pseudomonadota bacterium]